MSFHEMPIQKGQTKRVIGVMARHAAAYPATLTCLFISIVGLMGTLVLSPLLYKRLVDTAVLADAATPEVMQALFAVLGMIIVVKSCSWLLRRVRGSLTIRLETRVMADLARTAFEGLMRHSYRFFSDSFSGTLVRRVNKFVHAFEVIADQLSFSLIPSALIIAGSLVVLFDRNPILSLTLAVGVFVFVAFIVAAALWKQKYEHARNRRDSEATGFLADAIGNAATVKLFAAYAHEFFLFRALIERLRKARVLAYSLNEIIVGVQSFLLYVTEISMIAVALLLWQRGLITIGDFVLIQLYLISIFDRIMDFDRVLHRLFESFADAAEMAQILDEPYEVTDVPKAAQLQCMEGTIEFRNATLSFNDTRDVLDGLSLSILSKQKVALVGPSGAGKTTITRLLVRFHDISGGQILVDGQNIAEVTQESLWNAIALVPQEPVLFHRTLRENILYGRRDASDAEVIAAAKRAHCHEFISAFPKGYETYVGERGVKLSGGERQRVAIARAILKNAPILVLDEATSSLDSESEALIQEALHELMREKTVIAIAHRLSTIKEMDRIIVIDDGAIVAEGTHEELLQKDGIYRKLWDIQAGKFIG